MLTLLEPSGSPTTSEASTPHLFTQEDCLPGFVHHRGACYKLLDSTGASSSQSRSPSTLYDTLSTQCANIVSNGPLDCNTTRGLVTCPVIMTPHSHSEAAFMRLLVSNRSLPSSFSSSSSFSFSSSALPNIWTGLKIWRENGKVSSTSCLEVNVKNSLFSSIRTGI